MMVVVFASSLVLGAGILGAGVRPGAAVQGRLVDAPVTIAQAAPAYVSYYFDEPRELVLDTTRVAVFGTGVRNVRGADVGVAGAPIEYLPIAGAQFVSLNQSDQTRAGVERALDESGTLRAQSVGYVAPVFVGLDGGYVVPMRAILVQFDAGCDADACETALAKLGKIDDRAFGGVHNAYRVIPNTRDGRDVLAWAAELAQRNDTVYAEPDMMFTGSRSLVPNDPFFFNSWGLNNIGQSVGGIGTVDMDVNAAEAWDVTQGDPNTLTMIIDQGVQPDHPDLNQTGGMDFTTDNGPDGGPINNCDDHGTAVAGCVAGILGNSIGTCGVAPETRIVSARAMISNVPCNGMWTSVSSWTVNALAYGESLGVRVTNNSNRYGFTASSITNKYFLTRLGSVSADPMVHFAAAGNSSSTTVDYPSSLPSVNAISAMDNRGNIVGFSSRGPDLFMCGPGLDVWTTDRTGFDGYDAGDYGLLDGTSFASPIVAGVAALVLSQNPSLDATQVEDILRTTAKDLGDPGFDELFGWGLPDASAAIAAAGTSCPGDCDGSGVLNLDDIDCFATGFLAGDLSTADCDGSGILNFDDIDCFVESFLGGCP